jgi:hypothetical protein
VVVVVVVGFLPFNHTFTSHLCLAPLPRTFASHFSRRRRGVSSSFLLIAKV